jgi:hypothetical protein
MPLGNLPTKGITYNAATKKVVQSPGASSGASPGAMGVMGALRNAATKNVTAGGAAGALAGLYGPPKTQSAVAGAQTAGFSYDPTSDPVYQKALAAAKANAGVQQGNDLAYLNKRGLVGSDAGNAEIAQIGQNAVSDLEANLLPQLAQQAYGRYRDDINQKNTDETLRQNKGALTGYYTSADMDKAYADVNQAKTDYANAKTPEERIAAHNRAEAARSVITQLGGNSGLVGSNVTADQAAANKGHYGIETATQRQADVDNARNKKLDNMDAASAVSAMTGKVIHAQDDWNGLFRQGADPNTPLTAAGQGQQFSQGVQIAQLTGRMPDGTKTTAEQQRQLTNLWQQATLTGTIPDQLATMYGIPKGTKTQDAMQWASSFGLQQDQFQSGVDQDIYKMLLGDPSKPAAGPTAADIAKTISSSPLLNQTDPTTGKPISITDPNVQKSIESMIITQTQDPVIAVQLYNMYGIPVPAELTKEYQAALAAGK